VAALENRKRLAVDLFSVSDAIEPAVVDLPSAQVRA